MMLNSYSKFHIKSLNQEKLLNEISRDFSLFEIDRQMKTETTFKCSYLSHKKIQKILRSKNIEIVSLSHEGFLPAVNKIFSSYGVIFAVVLFLSFYIFQYQFIFQYEVIGLESLNINEIVAYVKENFSTNRNVIKTKDVEVGLVNSFEEISFASCIIKGQTLVINIKEKLLPEQIYGDFEPIKALKDGKITEINLVSGTLCVKVGDIVKAGDVLVEPYTLDTSGNIKQVEANAEILAEVYNEGSCDHYEKYIEIKRTGKTVIQNDITLFGLNIYTFKQENKFEMFEIETEEVSLIKNLFLPFKMKKTIYYELEKNLIESKFEDVKSEMVEKARQKALENCEKCDTIIDEYYTLRHLSGVTIVNYCIVTLENLGG